MNLVLDASATLAYAFLDERTDAILEVFDHIELFGAIVPELWPIEVANSLNAAIRRGRIGPHNRTIILVSLENLPIVIDRETTDRAWHETLSLTDKHRLTVYDATYLELTLRLSLPLATLDEDLRRAAQQEGVQLLGR